MPVAHDGVAFSSSDKYLVEGFDWAKAQAMAYVFIGDPVGDWYEAALPGREAFCMRDVAHQSTGAQVLGLGHCTRNMLRRFAGNISESRDWCTYWEIDKDNRPCAADYQDDRHFWYCLPANFDVMHCCLRQYLWTGDRTYLDDPAFRYFYAKSADEYVHRWDRDRDGLMEHRPEYGHRGIASYDEQIVHPLVAGDQVAAQYAGYLAFAGLAEMEGNYPVAEEFTAKAQTLRALYNAVWWNENAGRFNSFISADHTFCPDYHGGANFLPLYFGLVEAGRKTLLALEDVIRHGRRNIEERSYLPEIFYRYGRSEAAYAELCAQLDPAYDRREYPEVSYAVIGSLATGMMGLSPDARERTIATLPRLTAATAWAELSNVPALGNVISVRHDDTGETVFTNHYGPPLYWRATFPGAAGQLRVDGSNCRALGGTGINEQEESWVILRVARGETHRVSTIASS
jgi:hypothetical protein